MFCSACGKQLSSNARFCSSCGASTAPDIDNATTYMGNEPVGIGQTLDPDFKDAATLDNAPDISDGVTLDSPAPAQRRTPSAAPRIPTAPRLGSGSGNVLAGSPPIPKYSTPHVPRPPSASAGTLSSS